MAHPLADDVRVIANPIRMSETPARYDTPAPMLGQHSDRILGDLLGLDAAAIDELRKNKII
jgi:crotonobetainyl-CoA:carnitine CoA-transferase CaiB-like acyl-CoA transferase